mmetsp:Transcript_6160/g.15786  ORF Transcript_6160/g.15786 Transcript_6160/m.15786 type:complete len:292 (-) Transcript_6160:1365-2240(-)
MLYLHALVMASISETDPVLRALLASASSSMFFRTLLMYALNSPMSICLSPLVSIARRRASSWLSVSPQSRRRSDARSSCVSMTPSPFMSIAANIEWTSKVVWPKRDPLVLMLLISVFPTRSSDSSSHPTCVLSFWRRHSRSACILSDRRKNSRVDHVMCPRLFLSSAEKTRSSAWLRSFFCETEIPSKFIWRRPRRKCHSPIFPGSFPSAVFSRSVSACLKRSITSSSSSSPDTSASKLFACEISGGILRSTSMSMSATVHCSRKCFSSPYSMVPESSWSITRKSSRRCAG